MGNASLNALILSIHMVEYATHVNFLVVTAQMLILALHAHKIICLSEAAHACQVQIALVDTIYNKA